MTADSAAVDRRRGSGQVTVRSARMAMECHSAPAWTDSSPSQKVSSEESTTLSRTPPCAIARTESRSALASSLSAPMATAWTVTVRAA